MYQEPPQISPTQQLIWIGPEPLWEEQGIYFPEHGTLELQEDEAEWVAQLLENIRDLHHTYTLRDIPFHPKQDELLEALRIVGLLAI